MDFKNFIDWKSFIMGAAFASFICVVASQYQLDWLYAFAAIGLLYVGYKAKNMKWGAILGAIAATPLFVLAAYGVFGPLSDSSFDPQVSMFVTLIAVLISYYFFQFFFFNCIFNFKGNSSTHTHRFSIS